MAKTTAAGLDQPIISPRGAGDVTASARRSAAVTTGLAQNDLVVLGILPANCELVDVVLDSTDLDTATSPAIVLEAGILNAAEDGLETSQNCITGSTIGQTGGIQRANDANLLKLAPTAADRKIAVKVTTAGSAKAAGTLGLRVWYVAKN